MYYCVYMNDHTLWLVHVPTPDWLVSSIQFLLNDRHSYATRHTVHIAGDMTDSNKRYFIEIFETFLCMK